MKHLSRLLQTTRELLVLVLLFVVFVAAVFYFTQAGSETLPHTTPSSFNAGPPGTKALYLLYRNLGFAADRLETSWAALGPDDGLVIVTEPIKATRAPSLAEIEALKTWIERGGVALYSVSTPERGFDPADPLAGDISIVHGSDFQLQASVSSTENPLTQGLISISSRCPVRLMPLPSSGYQVLFRDRYGPVVALKRIGKGSLILIADERLIANTGIAEADNALLLVNIAHYAIGRSGRIVQFDEYHHGAGFDTAGLAQQSPDLWSSFPLGMKLALIHLIGFGLLILYNGNRRFGNVIGSHPQSSLASTDYLYSMARLLARARAGDVALITLYNRLKRELSWQLDLDPGASTEEIVARLRDVSSHDAVPLGTLLLRCTEIENGARITETEMLALTRQMEDCRRRLILVRN